MAPPETIQQRLQFFQGMYTREGNTLPFGLNEAVKTLFLENSPTSTFTI